MKEIQASLSYHFSKWYHPKLEIQYFFWYCFVLRSSKSTVSRTSSFDLVKLNQVSLLHNTLLTSKLFLRIIATWKYNSPNGTHLKFQISFWLFLFLCSFLIFLRFLPSTLNSHYVSPPSVPKLFAWFLAVVLTYRLFRKLNSRAWLNHATLRFLGWLSSAILKTFILGVSSRILIV